MGWTLPDEVLLQVAYQAVLDGTFHVTFFDSSVRSPEDFPDAMKDPTNYPVFAFSNDGDPYGFAWINGVKDNYCFAHFCGLKSGRGRLAREIGQMVMRYWMAMAPNIDFIFGMTPSAYPLALRFIEQIGFKKVGEIDKLIQRNGDRESAVFSYYSRFDHA